MRFQISSQQKRTTPWAPKTAVPVAKAHCSWDVDGFQLWKVRILPIESQDIWRQCPMIDRNFMKIFEIWIKKRIPVQTLDVLESNRRCNLLLLQLMSLHCSCISLIFCYSVHHISSYMYKHRMQYSTYIHIYIYSNYTYTYHIHSLLMWHFTSRVFSGILWLCFRRLFTSQLWHG